MIVPYVLTLSLVMLNIQQHRTALFCTGFVSTALGLAMHSVTGLNFLIMGTFFLVAGLFACADTIGEWLHEKVEFEYFLQPAARRKARDEQFAQLAETAHLHARFSETIVHGGASSLMNSRQVQVATRLIQANDPQVTTVVQTRTRPRLFKWPSWVKIQGDEPLTRANKIWLAVVGASISVPLILLFARIIFLAFLKTKELIT